MPRRAGITGNRELTAAARAEADTLAEQRGCAAETGNHIKFYVASLIDVSHRDELDNGDVGGCC